MCTATWLRTQVGYEVFFNRDELLTRKPALPPAPRERDGVRFLAPEDGDAGGTWIGVNELGVAIGIANGPRASDEGSRVFRSRGLLVLDLLSSGALEEVGRRLEAMERPVYRPFYLFAIEPEGSARIWSFEGESLEPRQAADGTLLVSSSRDFERARSERLALLDRMTEANGGLDADLLAAFHASHEPERGAFSPCMHREEARTVSFTRIRVGTGEVAMEYAGGPPCEHEAGTEIRLARSVSARGRAR